MALRILNFLLCGLSIILLNEALKGNLTTVFCISAVFFLSPDIIIFISQLYEIPFILLFLALIFYLFMKNKYIMAVYVGGLLYLIRPELLILSAIIFFLFLYKTKDRINAVKHLFLSLLPCIIYTLYMFANTGDFIPSSVSGRMLTAGEATYRDNFIGSFIIFTSRYNILLFFSAGSLVFIFIKNKKIFMASMLIAISTLLPYLIFPPAPGYILRYTAGILVFYMISCGFMANVVVNSGKIKIFSNVKACNCAALAVFFCAFSIFCAYYSYWRLEHHRKQDFSMLLGEDLAVFMNSLDNNKEDKILLYEIQMQYFLNNQCISLDGIVGSEIRNFLLRKETLRSLLINSKVKFIITMNSFNYRAIFADTPLVDLYNHDLSSSIGDEIVIDGLIFRKITTNPLFSEQGFYDKAEEVVLMRKTYNNGDNFLRLIAKDQNKWPNSHPFWNSVYEISS
jgi:hypothetical protein